MLIPSAGLEVGLHLLQVVAGLYQLPLSDPIPSQQQTLFLPTAKQPAEIVGFDAVRITRL